MAAAPVRTHLDGEPFPLQHVAHETDDAIVILDHQRAIGAAALRPRRSSDSACTGHSDLFSGGANESLLTINSRRSVAEKNGAWNQQRWEIWENHPKVEPIMKARTMKSRTRTASDIKDHWRDIVADAKANGEVFVTHYNRPEVVVVSIDRYSKLKADAQPTIRCRRFGRNSIGSWRIFASPEPALSCARSFQERDA